MICKICHKPIDGFIRKPAGRNFPEWCEGCEKKARYTSFQQRH